MKREVIVGLCGVAFILMLVIALFENRNVQDSTENTLHEITTFDLWKQTAYTTPVAFCPTAPQGQAYPNYVQGQAVAQGPIYPQGQTAVEAPNYLNGGQPYYPSQVAAAGIQQAALAPGAPIITDGQAPPTLIKQMGMEVIEITEGKVKITGVMGKSWADKAGLQAGDIILAFNKKSIESLKQFQMLVVKAPPEKPYRMDFLRGARKKHCLITVGEGEMEGFTPIPPPAVVK